MTEYLIGRRDHLVKLFSEMPDIEENAEKFVKCVDLIQWIDEHPEANRQQYLDQVEIMKRGPEQEVTLDLSQWGIPQNSARCRECPAWITWVRTRKGSLMPVNSDDTSHFANCPGAARRRRRA